MCVFVDDVGRRWAIPMNAGRTPDDLNLGDDVEIERTMVWAEKAQGWFPQVSARAVEQEWDDEEDE